MPPILASFLCVGFILWLFYRNAQGTIKLSPALWLPIVWLGIIASKPLDYWIQGNASDLGFDDFKEGSAVDRNVLLLMLFAGLVVLKNRRIEWGKVWQRNKWIWIFHAYALISVAWSDYPFAAFKRWIRDVANVVMLLIILTEKDPLEAVRQTFIRMAYLLIPSSILFMKYYPSIGMYYNQWTGEACLGGVTISKNSLAMLAMVSAVFLLWSLLATRRSGSWFTWARLHLPELCVLPMCLWILVAANSKTSLVSSVLAAGIFFAARLDWIRAKRARWNVLAWSLVLLSLAFFCVPSLRGAFTAQIGRSADLTDRTRVWEGCFGLKTNPLIGVGFASVWMTPQAIAMGEKLNINTAHNGYLEIYLNGGVIGVALLLAVIFSAARSTAKYINMGLPVGSLYAPLLLSCLIYNYTEATFNKGHIIGIVVWLIAIRYPPPVTARSGLRTRLPKEDGPIPGLSPPVPQT